MDASFGHWHDLAIDKVQKPLEIKLLARVAEPSKARLTHVIRNY
jgi:hypothetical protein